jgi:hypothetical protein
METRRPRSIWYEETETGMTNRHLKWDNKRIGIDED